MDPTGVQEYINEQSQQETQENKEHPVVLYGVQHDEKNVNVWIYIPQEIYIVKDQGLEKDQQNKAEDILSGRVVHGSSSKAWISSLSLFFIT